MAINTKQPSLIKACINRNSMNHYNRWIFNKLEKFLGTRILDIGSGTGNMIELFLPKAEKIVCLELFPENIEYMKNRFSNNKKVEFLLGDFVSSDICYDIYSFDTITCVNVLEHLEHDFIALKKMKNIVGSKGKIILFVPAFQFLYGTMDIASGHYRRYSPGVLKNYAEALDLKIISNFYINIFGIIPWYVKGKLLKRNKPYSETLNLKKIGTFNKLIPLLERIDDFNPFPVGISEIIVLQKD